MCIRDRPTTEQMHFLLELTELRYDNSSTIYCSQYSHLSLIHI